MQLAHTCAVVILLTQAMVAFSYSRSDNTINIQNISVIKCPYVSSQQFLISIYKYEQIHFADAHIQTGICVSNGLWDNDDPDWTAQRMRCPIRILVDTKCSYDHYDTAYIGHNVLSHFDCI